MGPTPLAGRAALNGSFVALYVFRINHFPKKRVDNSCAERGYGEMTRELKCGGEERGALRKGAAGSVLTIPL